MVNEEVSFESGGERCVATWYWPEGAAAHWPCAVLAGFSGTRDWILPDFARRFAGAGFAVLTFDYRHLGESEGTPRQIVDVHAPTCARRRTGLSRRLRRTGPGLLR